MNRLDCVYTDVDRHYFNRNVGTAATNYASIDIQAGYQRLCGGDALDYVRYRHGDNDLVRAARQHDFLRQARAQFGVTELLGDRHELLQALGEHTRTDIRGSKQVLALVKLAVDSAPASPSRRSRSRPRSAAPTSTPARTRSAPPCAASCTRPSLSPPPRRRRGAPGARRRAPRASPRRPTQSARPAACATRPAGSPARSTTARAPTRSRTNRARPTAPTASRCEPASASTTASRAPTGPTRRSSPPPTSSARSASRTFKLYYDGRRLRRVALQTAEGSWWVTNTLTLTLTNAQMLAIARSL